MTEQFEILPPSKEAAPVGPPIKWLRYLLYIHIASLVLSLVTMVWLNNPVTPWINHALIVGIVLCLLKLSPACKRYRTAGILTAIVLGLTLLAKSTLSNLVTLILSILSIIASYQEFYGHAEVLAEKDSKLAGRWKRLFLWQLLIGIISGFASVAATVIMVLANMEQSQIISLVVGAVGLTALIPGALYLIWLHKMIQLLKE